MSEPIDPRELDAFLRKAFDVQVSDPAVRITEGQLREIAQRAGLSDDDWDRLCESLESHVQKGRNFFKYGNFKEAAAELDQAVALAPYRADVLHDCGRAHLEWSKKGGPPDSAEQASMLFGKCLEIEPAHEGAAEGLSRLHHRKERHAGKKKRRGVAAVAALAGIAILAGGYVRWQSNSAENPAPNSSEPAALVPGEAIPFGDKIYQVIPRNMTWQEARDLTTALGGQLAVVNDTETQAFIERIAGDRRLWLGATDEGAEGNWRWIDGSPMEFTNWGFDRPDNNGRLGEHFLMLMPNGDWEDTKPRRPAGNPGLLPVDGFICEWPREKGPE